MKEFISAVEDIAHEDEREEKIAALIEQGKTREDAEAEVDGERFVEFKLDGRTMRAYMPHEGQLVFLLTSMGRGQSKEQRLAGILNIMFESLREDDKDYLEGRLLVRDPKKRVPMKQIEAIFEHLVEEWFRPDVSGDSAPVPTDG
jgi:hypothetical protein